MEVDFLLPRTGPPIFKPEKACAYIIYKLDSTYIALNGHTGKIIYSGTDADTIINNAITAVNAAGGGIVFLKEATYTINNAIVVKANVTVQGEGFSTIITLANSSNCHVFQCTGSPSNIGVCDLKIVGNEANQSSQGIGIYWIAVSNALIDNVWITDCRDHGINITNGSSDVLIQNCLIDDCAVGIYIYCNTASNHRVRISHCILDANVHGIHVVAVAAYYAYDMIVDHCIVTATSNHSINFVYVQRGVITGCTVRGTVTWNGIILQYCYYITVTGCTSYDNNDCGIILNWSRRCTITGNVCWGNGNYGILLNSNTDCDRNIVHGNITTTNNEGIIIGTGCDNNVVNDNITYGNVGADWWNGGAGNITNDNKIG